MTWRVGLVALVLVGCAGADNPARQAIGASKTPAAAPADAFAAPAGASWSCPMHPEVVQDHPGKCPKCGMDLVTSGA